MVYRNRDSIVINCNCRCGSSITFDRGSDGVSYVYTGVHLFSTLQESSWQRFKRRLKVAYEILLHGEYILHEVMLTPEDFKELQQIIKDI